MSMGGDYDHDDYEDEVDFEQEMGLFAQDLLPRLASERPADCTSELRLMQERADVDALVHEGRTLLSKAVELGDADWALTLIHLGAGVNRRAPGAKHPVSFFGTAESGNLPMSRLLVRYGANLALANEDGCSPAEVARKHGHEELASYFELWTLRFAEGSENAKRIERSEAELVDALSWTPWTTPPVPEHLAGGDATEQDPNDPRTWRGVYDEYGWGHVWVSDRSVAQILEHLQSLPEGKVHEDAGGQEFPLPAAGFVVFKLEGHSFCCIEPFGNTPNSLADLAGGLGGKVAEVSTSDEFESYRLFVDGELVEELSDGDMTEDGDIGPKRFESKRRSLSKKEINVFYVKDFLREEDIWVPGFAWAPYPMSFGPQPPTSLKVRDVVFGDEKVGAAFNAALEVFAVVTVKPKPKEKKLIPNPFKPGEMMEV